MFKQTHYNVHGLDSSKKAPALISLTLLLIFAYMTYCLLRPLSAPTITFHEINSSSQVKQVSSSNQLAWPAGTNSAIGTLDDGLLAQSSSNQKPAPIASVAKVITALTVLEKYPLSAGQSGPNIALTSKDVASYYSYAARGGSTVEVAAGETISQYQALQALLLPSANNMADSLAIWAYGSLPAYQASAQKFVDKLGLTQTTVGTDASGFDPSTKSTPKDLIKLAQIALANPVIHEIASQKSATIPVAGTIHSTNKILGTNDIIGIKTGNSDEAGGDLLFAAKPKIHGKEVTIIGIVMHDESVPTAMQHTLELLDSTKKQFRLVQAVDSQRSIGKIHAEWLNQPIDIYPQKSISLLSWPDKVPKISTDTRPISTPQIFDKNLLSDPSNVGDITVSTGTKTSSTSLVVKQPLYAPSILWRLTHPL